MKYAYKILNMVIKGKERNTDTNIDFITVEFCALIFNEEHVKVINSKCGRRELMNHKVDTSDLYCMCLASQHLRPLRYTLKAHITAELVYCVKK